MSQWLYGEEGYYASMPTIGKAGDFYTSVSTSMFFGGTLGKHLVDIIDEGFLSSKATVIEIGAHRGYLLADLIQFVYTLRPELLQSLSFVIVEPLKKAREAQAAYFKAAFGDAVQITQLASLEGFTCKEAYIVANELFDAFACEIIHEGKMLHMKGNEAMFVPLDETTKRIAERYHISRGEVGVGYEDFAVALSRACKKFEFVTFDYGDMAPRNDMSLRVYKSHKVYPFFTLTPFAKEEAPEDGTTLEELVNVSDLTYDVCFEHLKGAFEDSGATQVKYCTQMVGLVDFGISELLELLQKNVDKATYQNEIGKVNQLINPAYFGERFKMAVFRK